MSKIKATEKELLRIPKSGLTSKQLQKLFEVTPPSKIKRRPAKGGGEWNYVAGSYAKQVLNFMFGLKWDFQIDTSLEEAFTVAQTTRQSIVKGTLKVKIGDDWIQKTQFGRADIKFKKDENGKPTNQPLDFGNDMKAAATDCLKKCCNELGLFMDVYAQEDFLEAEITDEIAEEEDAVRKELENGQQEFHTGK